MVMKRFPNEIGIANSTDGTLLLLSNDPRNLSVEIFAPLQARIASSDQKQCAKM